MGNAGTTGRIAFVPSGRGHILYGTTLIAGTLPSIIALLPCKFNGVYRSFFFSPFGALWDSDVCASAKTHLPLDVTA